MCALYPPQPIGWLGQALIGATCRAGGTLRRRLAEGAGLRGSGLAAGQRAVVRVTNSAAARVTAVTTATDGHAPMRLARGCEPPIAATYTALRLAAAAARARYQSRADQAPAAANSAPPRSRRPVRRATRIPPARPRAATADDRDVAVPLTGFTLSAGARGQYHFAAGSAYRDVGRARRPAQRRPGYPRAHLPGRGPGDQSPAFPGLDRYPVAWTQPGPPLSR